MILGLFPSLSTHGGVERVGRHVAAVLSSFAREQRTPCKLFALNDPPGTQQMQVEEMQIRVEGFGRRKASFALSVLAAAPRARLIYVGHPNLAPVGLMARLLRPRLRYVVTGHGIDVWDPLPFPRQQALRRATAVTAPSQFTCERIMQAQKVEPSKVHLLPWALSPAFCALRDGAKQAKVELPKGKLLLTVARLATSEKFKGLDTVIQVMPRLLQADPQIRYVVVGDGDDRPRLEQLARDVGVTDHVLFAGARTDQELAAMYDACQVMVLPSRKEGFGLVFLEAMAFGMPVVGGNFGGTPEVVVDGETGFLVDYGNLDCLADRLLRLLSEPPLQRRMGEAGRRRLEEHYTFEIFNQRLRQILTSSS